MVTGCDLLGPVGPVCGSFARWAGVWRDVSRRHGEVASFSQGDLGDLVGPTFVGRALYDQMARPWPSLN